MTLKPIIKTALLCFTVSLAITSCSNENKDSKKTAEEMNEQKFDKEGEDAADKLVHAYSANMFEIKAAENAALNAITPEVKKLSAMLVEAHTKMNADVKILADLKNISLPTDLTEEQRKDLEKLAEKTGLEYDKAFVEKMKTKHEAAVKFYEETAAKCDDEAIKNWAAITTPEVRSHLDMVLVTENDIKDKK
ncbi:MAG: DUF4142 domain-containing protein [Bacteroidota bacterium]